MDVGEEAALALLDEGNGKVGDEEHADVQVGIVLRVLGVGILDIRGVLLLLLLCGEGILPILWLSTASGDDIQYERRRLTSDEMLTCPLQRQSQLRP